jgi:nitroreductase
MTVDLDVFEELIRARRSSLLCDRAREVPTELIERLCGTIAAAPNHKRTVPWRLAAFVGDGRRRLGEAFAADLLEQSPDVDVAKLDKVRTKYGRAPVIVVVGCRADDDHHRHREDTFAVAAGIEHFLLGAAAAGLRALWSSPPVLVSPRVAGIADFEPDTELVGVVYVGWPAGQAPESPRPTVPVTWVC